MLDKLRKDLEAQIATLDHELRVSLPKEIKKALEYGDLRENAEYKAALERQELVKARIGQLKKRMAELALLDVSKLPHDRAAYGSIVTVVDLDSGAQLSYRLVISEEADAKRGWISVTSPIGKGLVGKEPGDETVIQTPGGTKRYSIEAIQTLHDQ